MIQPDTAGVDIGATEVCAAVPLDRDPRPVRTFGTFTPDLEALVAWLQQCRIRSVAMEATGVYWIPLFQLLAARYGEGKPNRKIFVYAAGGYYDPGQDYRKIQD